MARKLCVGVFVSLLLASCSGSAAPAQQATGRAQPGSAGASASDPSSANATSTCSPPYSLSSQACDACLEQLCCDAVTVCSANDECNDAYGCLSTCLAQPNLEGCPGRCFGNGDGPPLFDAVLACVFDPCAAECTITYGE